MYTMLFLSFFYVSGLLISVVTIKNKKLTFRIAFLFWIILIVLIPELSKKFTENRANRIQSIEKINIEKLNTVMDFERKAMETYLEKIKKGNVDQLKLKREIISDYVNGGFKANEKIENELHNEVKGMVFFLEKFSLIFPTTYYPFLADEISGEGYYSYLSFFDSIKQIRRNFMKFYSDKRNFSKRTAVESFIKKDENIFKAKPHLPKTFWLAITILLALNSILLLFTLKKTKYYLKQNRKKPFNSPFDFQKIKVGNVYYIFCGNEIQRDNLFDSLKGNETISIDPLTLDDFDPNIKLKNFLHLAEKIENTNTEKLHTYLQKLDIPSEMLNKRIEEVPFETFKKFFCAVKFANQQNYIIISDYARGSSKDFNHKFRSLLADINKEEGKTILYLSSEMFDLLSVRLKAEEIRENSLYQVYPIDDITTIAL